VPAPAVIPAPRAYINAVAVKGFVVELRVAKPHDQVPSSGMVTIVLAIREHSETNIAGLLPPRFACNVCREAPVCLTVTKKARPKQSFDMNLKAWDNKGAAYGLPFRLLLVLKVCGRLWIRMTSGFGVTIPTPPLLCDFGCGWWLAASRNEGGLFGGERTCA